ncbi:antitoxin CptB [Cricetibacter osteomyelitidis]|uniref:FAD assembly factor SdhE n=1 Tax=Cricetibacter osteomyelitidis TaxID=1521931 RepID=A0A4R2SL70_9PAST|nr:succinate dehydrogenase assembly factor 2 [Cricetibacter osteomyelitidis]TCP88806.1 antitoxin CptB [Cricetibacter osteomyelitidis]
MAENNQFKLEWNCRRGMLELDNVIMPFYKQHFVNLNEQQKQAFIRLLDCTDLQLFSWIFKGSEPEDVELRQIVTHIQNLQILKRS